MKKTRFYVTLLILVMFAGIFSLSPTFSLLMNRVIIGSTGQISTSVYARSGSARDIQAAVDLVVSRGGIGNVYIPSGTFNFVEVGEPWTTVNIPAGINLFGAPTERDANDQVVEWKTVLVMPWEVPSGAIWFAVDGNEDPNKPFRFSDIKLVGWRFYNTSSTTQYTGLRIWRTLDFRVDHCHFQDLAGEAISTIAPSAHYNRHVGRGVIDHNIIVNTIGKPYGIGGGLEGATLGYGISILRWACDVWEPNAANVFGKYNNYTVFIEDNYFSKWRHCVASNHGVHYVFRHNIVEGDYGYGSVDAHGSYANDAFPYAVGTRAIEVYNNIFKNPDTTYAQISAILLRGGAGIIFNNTFINYRRAIQLDSDVGNYAPWCPQCYVNQTYIWDNNLGGGTIYSTGPQQNVHYFLRAPNQQQDGFTYTPYPYPHPLTLKVTP